MNHIHILSLFPGMFTGVTGSSIVARAIERKAIKVTLTDIRSYSQDKHRKVDDYAYGGFPGMVMQPQPVFDAIRQITAKRFAPVIYFTPQGRPLTQSILAHYAKLPRVILLCGHYKEIDQRVRDLLVSDEISLGDFVLSGGEIAAMAFLDGIARLQDGVLSDPASAESDSFSIDPGKLGFPCYTRPEEWIGVKVPQVLREGNHRLVRQWAEDRSTRLTRVRRPDLLRKRG